MLRFFLINFGPMAVFMLAYHFWGLKAGVILSILWVAAEGVYLYVRRQKPTSLFMASAAAALVFGSLDLWLESMTFMKLEAGLINLMFAAVFGVSLWKEKSLVQELAEQRVSRQTEPDETADLMETDPTDRDFFFRFLTWVWCGYFLIRAGLFTWLNFTEDFSAAWILRQTIGHVSFYVLLGLSIFGGRQLWILIHHLRLLPTQRFQTSQKKA